MPVFRIFSCLHLLFFLLLPAVSPAGTFQIEKDDKGVAIRIDGELFTRYISGDDSNKPYFWPLIGPDGVSMTRAFPMENVEGERQDHPHHRSMYFGHQDINGFNTWHEESTFGRAKEKARELPKLARNETVKMTRAEVLKDRAVLETSGIYTNASGKVLLTDERRFVFRVDPENGSRIVDVELTFIGAEGGSILGDIKDAGFSIRVAHSMSVDAKQGGRIITSAGQVDKKAWGKRTAWCDFNGTVDGKKVGIAMLMHPSSYGYPAPWHVRTYGLFTSNPFGLKSVAREEASGALTLDPGERATLQYRVILHRGDEKDADIEGAFKAYSAEVLAAAAEPVQP